MFSCNGTKQSNNTSNHTQHDEIIQQDLYNKQRELEILREIHAAQANQDEEAFKFFLSEYFEVPRLSLTDTQKQHPKFKEWLDIKIIKSHDYLDPKYDYIK